jgi:ketohexokinase
MQYILDSKATGSRTIIHHRDLSELSVASFCEGYSAIKRSAAASDHPSSLWVHFEGRNLSNVEEMMQFLRSSEDSVAVSLEIEAHRNDWDHIQRCVSCN